MPDQPVSTFGAEIDGLYYLILWVTGAVFVLVELALIVFLIKYRHREGRRATYTHGSKRAEIIWTTVPFVLVLFLAAMSSGVWLRVKDPARGAPQNALPMRVMAKQFEWNVTYPGPDERLDTPDDFVVRNQLHLPVDRAVVIALGSEDVIHSFFLPQFRVKQDAVPGMVIPVWFEATTAGQYALGCAELCGLGHYRMRGSVTVHTTADYQTWMTEEGAGAAPAAPPPATGAAADSAAAHDTHDATHTGHGGADRA
ncbi:MAG: cytochrome c oxidase subunit II [Gemmatimonadota bacterium]